MSMMVMESQRAALKGQVPGPNGPVVERYGLSARFTAHPGDDKKMHQSFYLRLPVSLDSMDEVYSTILFSEDNGYPLIASNLNFPQEKYKEIDMPTGRMGHIRHLTNICEEYMRQVFSKMNSDYFKERHSLQMTLHRAEGLRSWVSLMSNSEKKGIEIIGNMDSVAPLNFLNSMISSGNISRMLKSYWKDNGVHGTEIDRRIDEITAR